MRILRKIKNSLFRCHLWDNYGGSRTLPAFHAMLTIFCKLLQTNVWSGLLMARLSYGVWHATVQKGAASPHFHNGTDFDQLLQVKHLGQEFTRFGSETPWNDLLFHARWLLRTNTSANLKQDLVYTVLIQSIRQGVWPVTHLTKFWFRQVRVEPKNSPFQGVSEANLCTFLPRFSIGFPSENSTTYGMPLGWRSCRIKGAFG